MLPLLNQHASLHMKVAQLTLEHILQQHAAVITQAATQAVGTRYGRLVQQQQSGKRLHTLQHAQQHQQLVSQPASPAFVPRGQVPTPLLHQLWPAQQLLHSSQYHHHYQQQQQQLVCAQQHLRHYHPATHAARGLTSRLLQQRTWQELRMLFDASGGGGRLNPIQLCALLRHLARLAPAPELLTATERSELGTFAQELTAACMHKVHRMDAVGLANVISSALKLGCTLPLQQQQQQQQQQGSAYADILAAATKQVAYAGGHAAGMLLAALTNLHQQQQQQQQHHPQALQQQLILWHKLTLALSQRLQACVAVQQLSSGDASKLCSTVSRLSGLFVRQRTAAAAAVAAGGAAAAGTLSPQQQQQQDGLESDSDSALDSELGYSTEGYTAARSPGAVQPAVGTTTASGTLADLQHLQLQYRQLQQQLRVLLSLAAQQVQQQASAQGGFVLDPAGAAATGPSLADFSRVLNALAKTWAWPGWPAVQGLLQQYSSRFEAVQIMAAAAAAVEEQQSGASRKGHKQRRQAKQQTPLSGVQGLLGFVGVGDVCSAQGQGCGPQDRDTGSSAELVAAVRDSLAPTVWAVGRLSEQRQQQGVTQCRQQQQQQQQWEVLLQELQQHQQLWKSLSPVLGACQQQLSWLGPSQLAQVAAGLGKLVASSRSLLEAATIVTAAAVAGTAASEESQAATTGTVELDAACDALKEVLNGPQLRRLLQQHVGRVESLLPLLVRQHRLQVAAAYSQLGLQVPQAVASVFGRDAAQQQQK